MFRSEDHWLGVAEGFQAAAISGEWPKALNALADATGADFGQLIGVGSDTAVPFNWMPRADPRNLEEFVALDGGDPAVNPRVARGLTDALLQSWHDADCIESALRARNEPYADMCRRQDIPHGSQATLVRNAGMLIGLAVIRGARKGRPDAAARAAFEAIVPYAQAAVRLQLALEGQGAALLAGALTGLKKAAFVLDSLGKVRACTEAGEALLETGLVRLRSGKLSAPGAVVPRSLETAIEAARAAEAPIVKTLAIGDPARPSTVQMIDVASLPRQPYGFGFGPRVLVAVRGSERTEAAFSGVLAQTFGLTPSETEIALRLATGEPRETIAEQRRASLGTIRTHIKSIFAKLDVRREAELAARLGRLR